MTTLSRYPKSYVLLTHIRNAKHNEQKGSANFLPVKCNPLDIVHQYKARGDEKLAEMLDVDAILGVLLKVQARLCKQIN